MSVCLYNCCHSESFFVNCLVDFMIAESYFVKSNNHKDDILCGRMLTVVNGHFNEFVMAVNVKSIVK